MKNLIIIPLIGITILLSCHRTRTCEDGGIHITFKGYDSLSVDTVIINQYEAKSSFTNLTNQRTLIVQNEQHQIVLGELLYLFENYYYSENDGPIRTMYEWEIITKNHTYKLNGFSVNKKTEKVGIFGEPLHPCKSPISEYYLNNVKTINSAENVIYLDK